MDYATKIISEKDSLDILFINFEKAFDKVSHQEFHIGPILFIIYINDLTDIISNSSKMYVDDTNVNGRIRKTHVLEDFLIMQDDSYDSQEPILLDKTKEKKDFGVFISNNLKFTGQANKVASVANKKLGMFKRTFRSRGAGI